LLLLNISVVLQEDKKLVLFSINMYYLY